MCLKHYRAFSACPNNTPSEECAVVEEFSVVQTQWKQSNAILKIIKFKISSQPLTRQTKYNTKLLIKKHIYESRYSFINFNLIKKIVFERKYDLTKYIKYLKISYWASLNFLF